MRADLVLLVADKNIEHAVRGLLGRPPALGIRPVTSKIYVHPQRDPACARKSHEFLRQFSRDYHRALVLFDHRGSGMEGRAPEEIEADGRNLLSVNGWDSRADVVVIVPELEAWVFANSSAVQSSLRWSGQPTLRQWLEAQAFWSPEQLKPADPKAALEAALVKLRRSRSSAIYGELASAVNLGQCQDPAFIRFRTILQDWFPATEA